MRYFRRRWNENRGDAHEAWGASWWFFETDDLGNVRRQVEQYDLGPTLRYDSHRQSDEFGGLSPEPLALAEFEPFASDQAEFECAWLNATPTRL